MPTFAEEGSTEAEGRIEAPKAKGGCEEAEEGRNEVEVDNGSFRPPLGPTHALRGCIGPSCSVLSQR